MEKDPTKFCTYEEFETGVTAMREFCLLRAESVAGQLDGSIPSTSEGQSADSSNLVDASELNISDLGTMGGGMGGGGFGDFGGNRGNKTENGFTMPEGMEFPDGNMQMPQGGNLENRGEASDGASKTRPDMSGMQIPDMGNMKLSDSGSTSFVSAETIVLLAASIACLLAGLLVAFKYKR